MTKITSSQAWRNLFWCSLWVLSIPIVLAFIFGLAIRVVFFSNFIDQFAGWIGGIFSGPRI